MMRPVDALLARYGESHRHPVNKAIHWVCVPLITWTVLALAWALAPAVAVALALAACVFYAWLSRPLAVGMLAVLAALAYPLTLIDRHRVHLASAGFILAWSGQFVGHIIEGRKASFIDALKVLLIG